MLTQTSVVTFPTRRLQWMAGPCAPSSWKQIPGVISTPVVKCSLPPVKNHVDLITVYCSHCRWAQQLRVFPIDCFQFHSDLEFIVLRCRRLLDRQMVRATYV